MAVYRYQIVNVGMWRGKIKRWNTTLHNVNSGATNTARNIFQNVCYPAPGDVLGDCSGGVASIAVYASSGGQPISNTVFFDWQTPSEWIPYTGSVWSGIPEGTPLDAAGESAMVVEGLMAGLSATGKPVRTRKFIHAVPSRTSSEFNVPDIPAGVETAVKALLTPAWMLNPAGVTPASVSVDEWYGNHQRVRGRRRTVRQVAG